MDLAGLLQLTGYESVVHGGDTVFFPFADLLAQIVGFLDVFRSQTGLSQICVCDSDTGIGGGEIGVEFESTFIERNRLGISLCAESRYALSVLLTTLSWPQPERRTSGWKRVIRQVWPAFWPPPDLVLSARLAWSQPLPVPWPAYPQCCN